MWVCSRVVEISWVFLHYQHSPSVSHGVWIWFLVGEESGSSSHSESLCSPSGGDHAHPLLISVSLSIGYIYNLILLPHIFLSQINPHSNSNHQVSAGVLLENPFCPLLWFLQSEGTDFSFYLLQLCGNALWGFWGRSTRYLLGRSCSSRAELQRSRDRPKHKLLSCSNTFESLLSEMRVTTKGLL